jgi:transposase
LMGIPFRHEVARLGLRGLNQKRTPMERYIGLDVHAQSCTLVVVSGTGRQLKREVVETNGAALKQAVRAVPGPKRICLEEGVQSAWVYELLQGEAEEVVVTMPAKRAGTKDDARDAAALAESLRTGTNLQRVYKKVGPYSELRAAVRSYVMLRSDVGRTKNRLKGLFRSRGLVPAGGEAFHEEKHTVWVARLPKEHRWSAEVLLAELQTLEKLRSEAEERLHEASKPHRIVRLLATAPGIGPIRAAQVVATVVTPQRFRTKRQFWAYCGLGIMTRSSADWVKDRSGRWVRAQTQQTLGLNRNRCGMMKEVFKGAAHQVVTRMKSHPLHVDYQRLLERGLKPNLAKVTVARRIAAAVLAMWKNEEVYDPKKHQTQMTAQA